MILDLFTTPASVARTADEILVLVFQTLPHIEEQAYEQ